MMQSTLNRLRLSGERVERIHMGILGSEGRHRLTPIEPSVYWMAPGPFVLEVSRS